MKVRKYNIEEIQKRIESLYEDYIGPEPKKAHLLKGANPTVKLADIEKELRLLDIELVLAVLQKHNSSLFI